MSARKVLRRWLTTWVPVYRREALLVLAINDFLMTRDDDDSELHDRVEARLRLLRDEYFA